MTGAGACRTSCWSVAVRPAWTGTPCSRSLSPRCRATIGWLGRCPGNSHCVSKLGPRSGCRRDDLAAVRGADSMPDPLFYLR